MKRIYITLMALFVSISSFAATVTDNNRTITSVGTQYGQTYFIVTPAPSTTCLFGVIYVDSSTAAGKLQYAMLLSAYSNALPLSRIDYATIPGGQCFASLLAY